MPFIRAALKRRTYFSVLYYLVNIACLGLTAYLFVREVESPADALGQRVVHFSYGLAIAFLLVPCTNTCTS